MTDQPTVQRVPAAHAGLPEAPVFSTAAVVASCAGFVLIGALQALYGPSIPAFRKDFHLSPSAAGLGLSAHFIGGVVGMLLFDRLFGRIGNRQILATSYLLMAVGAAGFALAPSWPVALAMALLAGLGFGGIDYGLNQLFAVGFGHRSTTMLNILNAHFGIGAILGPALVGTVGANHYPAVFIVFALANLPLLLCLRGVRNQAPRPGDSSAAEASEGRAVGRSLRSVLAVFVTLYVLHVGIEAGVGGWEPTHHTIATCMTTHPPWSGCSAARSRRGKCPAGGRPPVPRWVRGLPGRAGTAGTGRSSGPRRPRREAPIDPGP